MPLCVHFVDFNHGIREKFLKYSVLTRITGESIAACVLKDLGLDDANCRGQGYDGASNMSSAHVGLFEKSLLWQFTPTAQATA